MKNLKLFFSALLLSVCSFVFLSTSHAFATTRTWDGGGSDDNMTTAANWSTDVAPSAADDLVFPGSAAGTVVNDFSAATSFNSITFNGTATSTDYDISGNSMTIVAGISESMSGSELRTQTLSTPFILNATQTIHANDDSTLAFTGVLSGSGALTFNGDGEIQVTAANTFTGTLEVLIPVRIKHSQGLGNSSAATTVGSSGKLIFEISASTTISEPINFSVGAYQDESVMRANVMCSGVPCSNGELTFSGAMAFTEDSVIATTGKVTLTGALSGSGKTVTLAIDATGLLVLSGSSNNTATANGSYGAGVTATKTLSGDQPTHEVAVTDKNTVIITGTYGDVTVLSGGILKGTGTVGDISVLGGGKLAPGTSPGCLNSGDLTFASGASYEFEIGGTTACTEYDQTKVTGTVTANGTLNVVLYNGFKPKAGQKYVIVSNDGADAVVGTFTSLAQGASFTANGYTYSISYTGGDGNDIELTVTAVAPDTGFVLIANNPFWGVGAMLAAAVAIAFIARRKLRFAVSRRRR